MLNRLMFAVCVFLAIGIAATLSSAERAGAEARLDQHTLTIECRPSLATYVSELRTLVDFAESNIGLPVYISINVQANDGTGYCAVFEDGTNSEAAPEDHGIREPFTLRPEGTVVVWARTPEHTAGTTGLELPPLDQLPDDGLYEASWAGRHFYRYVGVAVLRLERVNGHDHVILSPVRDSHLYWEDIHRVRKAIR